VAVNIPWTLNVGVLNSPRTPQGILKDSVVQSYTSSQRQQRYDLLQGALSRIIERKLTALQDALDAFEWPETGSMALASDLLSSKIETALPAEENRYRTERYASKGYEPTHAANLLAGEYEFTLTQGDDEEEFTITVEDDWTNADLLQAVAGAVNDSELLVKAEVVTQAAAQQRIAGLMATGQALVITVNQSLSDQDLALKDTSGHLIKSLGLYALDALEGDATQITYHLQGNQPYSPSAYLTRAFDPNEETTLSAGLHAIDYEIGELTGSVSFAVDEGDTWEDVLDALSNQLNTQSHITAETVTEQRVAILNDDDYELVDGLALRIQAENAKVGWRLYLSGDDLDTLGLDATTSPGADGRISINGETYVQSPGVFATNEGALLIGLNGIFGESLPLKVVSSLENLQTIMTNVVEAYNDLRKTLVRNEDLLASGYADQWREALAAESFGLKSIGLQEFGQSKEVWFNGDAFYSALSNNPDKVRSLLDSGENALIPAWREITQSALSRGADAALITSEEAGAGVLSVPQALTENELAKGAMLLDLYDNLPDPSGNKEDPEDRSLVRAEA
jgi:hypothetical protein